MFDYITDPSDMRVLQLLHDNGTKYCNILGAFDIETSNILKRDDNGEIDPSTSFALPYSFQLGFCDISGAKIFYLFRTAGDFVHFMTLLNKAISKPLCIFIHNAGFEFEHVKSYLSEIATLNPDDFFFNNSRRKVLYFRAGNFEFRDSYQLTGKSLRKVGEDLAEKGYDNILKGTMDYDLIRTPATPLTDDEIFYSLQDVNILLDLWRDELKYYGKIANMPLTNTGRIRKELHDYMKPHRDELNQIKAMQPSYYASEALRRAFYGGFTHACRFHALKPVKDVICQDLASAHPASMLIEKYPVGKVFEVAPKSIQDLKDLYKDYCFWGTFQFVDISTEHQAPSIFKSDNTIVEGGEWWNGKLVYAKKITISLCDLDLFRILDIYHFSSFAIGEVYASKKDYLPLHFRKFVMRLYRNKTMYKGVKDKVAEYKLSKILLNSVFGATAMNPIRDVYRINLGDLSVDLLPPYTGTKFEGLPLDAAFAAWQKARKTDQCYLSHIWGAYTTMYTRMRLFKLIDLVGDRFVYCDTDSVYYTVEGLNSAQKGALDAGLAALNKEITDKYVAAFRSETVTLQDEYFNPDDGVTGTTYRGEMITVLNNDVATPYDPSGTPRPIGIWTLDGIYSIFGTRGAKSYLDRDIDGTWKLTHSGLPKAAVGVFTAYNDPLLVFLDSEFVIPASSGFHKSKVYQARPLSGDILDYQGIPYHYSVPSSLVIYASDYCTKSIN